MEDECRWHRLDCLRFRSHPCFRLPNDPMMHPDISVQGFPVDGGNAVAAAATGVSFVEIVPEGSEVCRAWVEFPVENGSPQRQVVLNEGELKGRLPKVRGGGGNLAVRVRSYGGGELVIPALKKMCGKGAALKLGGGKVAYRQAMIPATTRAVDERETHDVIFMGGAKQNGRVLSRVAVHRGPSPLEGLEFVYDDGSAEVLGRKGEAGKDVFEVDIRRGEYLTGFNLRVAKVVEGVQFLTSVGRKSGMFGEKQGGSL